MPTFCAAAITLGLSGPRFLVDRAGGHSVLLLWKENVGPEAMKRMCARWKVDEPYLYHIFDLVASLAACGLVGCEKRKVEWVDGYHSLTDGMPWTIGIGWFRENRCLDRLTITIILLSKYFWMRS